jgi:hypothetical protein
MAALIAAVSHIFANMPIVHFAQDGKGYEDLTFRVFLGHNEVNDPSDNEDQLEDINSYAKVATAALRIPIFADNKGWAKKNDDHDIDEEPKSRKLNPVIAEFKKAHGRLPAIGDTITVTSNSEIFVPTTFLDKKDKHLTGKYSAPMSSVLTREQWDDIPESQKNSQNCIYEILNTTGISIVATEQEEQGAPTATSGRLQDGW